VNGELGRGRCLSGGWFRIYQDAKRKKQREGENQAAGDRHEKGLHLRRYHKSPLLKRINTAKGFIHPSGCGHEPMFSRGGLHRF